MTYHHQASLQQHQYHGGHGSRSKTPTRANNAGGMPMGGYSGGNEVMHHEEMAPPPHQLPPPSAYHPQQQHHQQHHVHHAPHGVTPSPSSQIPGRATPIAAPIPTTTTATARQSSNVHHPPTPINHHLHSTATSRGLLELIEQRQFAQVIARIQANPIEASMPLSSPATSGIHNIMNTSGNLALHAVCKQQPTMDIVQCLLDAHPSAISTKGEWGFLPLHVACASKADPEIVAHLIATFPIATRTKDDHQGRLPLHVAAQWGAEESLMQLLMQVHPKAAYCRDVSGQVPVEVAHQVNSAVWTGGEEHKRRFIETLEKMAPLLCKVSKVAREKMVDDSDAKCRELMESYQDKMYRLKETYEDDKANAVALEASLRKQAWEAKEEAALLQEQVQQLSQQLERKEEAVQDTKMLLRSIQSMIADRLHNPHSRYLTLTPRNSNVNGNNDFGDVGIVGSGGEVMATTSEKHNGAATNVNTNDRGDGNGNGDGGHGGRRTKIAPNQHQNQQQQRQGQGQGQRQDVMTPIENDDESEQTPTEHLYESGPPQSQQHQQPQQGHSQMVPHNAGPDGSSMPNVAEEYAGNHHPNNNHGHDPNNNNNGRQRHDQLQLQHQHQQNEQHSNIYGQDQRDSGNGGMDVMGQQQPQHHQQQYDGRGQNRQFGSHNAPPDGRKEERQDADDEQLPQSDTKISTMPRSHLISTVKQWISDEASEYTDEHGVFYTNGNTQSNKEQGQTNHANGRDDARHHNQSRRYLKRYQSRKGSRGGTGGGPVATAPSADEHHRGNNGGGDLDGTGQQAFGHPQSYSVDDTRQQSGSRNQYSQQDGHGYDSQQHHHQQQQQRQQQQQSNEQRTPPPESDASLLRRSKSAQRRRAKTPTQGRHSPVTSYATDRKHNRRKDSAKGGNTGAYVNSNENHQNGYGDGNANGNSRAQRGYAVSHQQQQQQSPPPQQEIPENASSLSTNAPWIATTTNEAPGYPGMGSGTKTSKRQGNNRRTSSHVMDPTRPRDMVYAYSRKKKHSASHQQQQQQRHKSKYAPKDQDELTLDSTLGDWE